MTCEELQAIDGIVMLAAGTSHYASQVARYWIEGLAKTPVTCEIASEYHYRNPVTTGFTTAIAISQSGESLDTLKAMRHAATCGLSTIGLVNVAGSTIAREADSVLPTHAGPEIGVASTKAFTAQLTVLISFAIALAEAKGHIDSARADAIHDQLQSLPGLVGKTLNLFDKIRPIAHQLKNARSTIYLGRGHLFPVAMEGALKLKELSYIHAEGFASGEMKHGPIALIEDDLPVVALLAADELLEKAASNLKEASARGGRIILIADERAVSDIDFEADIITVPAVDPLIAPIVLTIPVQILAYLTALDKGTDVDQPRNLAKSVTVE
jgi:glucosamine--fructose-6-phosphate aminotransferase (isomerizing)